MKEDARRTYRGFSTFFVVTGLVFLGLSLLQLTSLSIGLRGDPLWVALLLIVIGGSLRWTVRRRRGEDGSGEDEGGEADGRDVEEDR